MKQTVLFAALGLAAFGAAAQEVGNVLSAVPVIQQVAVPRTVCAPVAPAQVTTTGGGAVVGGLTGAAIGSTLGQGSGNAAAIAAGTIIGAVVGNNVEAQNQRYAQTVPQCTTQTTVENHIVAYDVTYEYRGQRYSARMPYDPGRTVQLQMQQTASQAVSAGDGSVPAQAADGSPAPMVTTPVPVATTTVQAAPTYVQAAPTYVQAPAPIVYAPYPSYPAYPVYSYPYAYPYPYYRPYYPWGVSLGFVFGGGHYHHH
ncbi:MAG: hypothetical protein KGL68_17940 [Burkholderiales bacterium]|nr:hypothetical protein [Burkholderiales bacterium]